MQFFDADYVQQVEADTRGSSAEEHVVFLRDMVLGNFNNPFVLDMCCGHGRHLKLLQSDNHSLVGVENNQRFIEMARQNAPRCQYILCDARRFTLPNYFDVCLLLENSINIFGQDQARIVLTNIYSSLTCGGILFMHTFNPIAATKLPRTSWILDNDLYSVREHGEFDITCSTLTITREKLYKRRELSTQNTTKRILLHTFSFDDMFSLVNSLGFRVSSVADNFLGIHSTFDRIDNIFICEKLRHSVSFNSCPRFSDGVLKLLNGRESEPFLE
jgi:SAM-dependent methyltransferase